MPRTWRQLCSDGPSSHQNLVPTRRDTSEPQPQEGRKAQALQACRLGSPCLESLEGQETSTPQESKASATGAFAVRMASRAERGKVKGGGT